MGEGSVAQIIYIHASKCKNDKIIKRKKSLLYLLDKNSL
jgi:hypothetical protein